MAPLRPSDVLDEATKLLAQGNQDLIFILDRLCDATLEPVLWAGEWTVVGTDHPGRE